VCVCVWWREGGVALTLRAPSLREVRTAACAHPRGSLQSCPCVSVCVGMCACVLACVRACVRVLACVWGGGTRAQAKTKAPAMDKETLALHKAVSEAIAEMGDRISLKEVRC
jgi:hypothetical protein